MSDGLVLTWRPELGYGAYVWRITVTCERCETELYTGLDKWRGYRTMVDHMKREHGAMFAIDGPAPKIQRAKAIQKRGGSKVRRAAVQRSYEPPPF